MLDEHGSYYWHIKSGITQRELPSPVREKPLYPAKTSKAKVIQFSIVSYLFLHRISHISKFICGFCSTVEISIDKNIFV